MTIFLIGLLTAGVVGYVAYGLMPIPAAYWKARLGVVLAEEEQEGEDLPFWRAILLPIAWLVERFAPVRWLLSTRRQLYWAQRAGEWQSWTEADVWALRLTLALGGLLLGILLGNRGLTVGGLAFGLLYPGMKLSGAAEKVQRRFLRELPEATQNLSLMVSTGLSLFEALQRLADGSGLVASWVRDTLAAARGQPTGLFTPLVGVGEKEPEMGILRRRALDSGMQELINLAVQMDTIQQKGTGAEKLLGDLAASVAGDYNAEVRRRAEALGGKLVFPVMIFYFIPYLAALLMPMIWSLIGFMSI
jgi:hypothetical protein